MGLDMYALAVAPDELETPNAMVDLRVKDTTAQRETLFYWRKHHDLHGWMRDLYYKKGGQDPDFNCNTVRLTADDLDALERAVKEDGAALPPTSGFFFGDNPPDDDSRAQDLEFITKARAELADGKVVFYDSWW